MNTSVASAESGQARERRARRLNFDRLAGAYRWMEWLSFGSHLWRTRCAFLPAMDAARRALVLGDGDGRFTAALLRRNERVQVEAVDVSEAMLQSLLGRAGADVDRVRTEACDVREWSPPPGAVYDLVVTHFFLDCLTTDEVRGLAERVKTSLAPGAMWVVSEFAVPAGWFGRLVARPVVGLLYGAFRLLTGLQAVQLPEWRAALEDAGFTGVAERRRLRGLLVSEVWRVG